MKLFFQTLNDKDKVKYLKQIAVRLGISNPIILEKDFWVSWMLREMSKHYRKEMINFVRKWRHVDNKNTKWIIRNGIRNLQEDEQNKLIGG